MADNAYRILPYAGSDRPREVAEIVNQAMGGKLNCTGSFSPTASTTSTTVTDFRAGGSSVILWTPLTAGAAALTGLYISDRSKQSFTVTHGTATGSESFAYIVIG